MSQMSEERIYINDEIITYMTSNKVLAFKDRMNLAPVSDYARIHAQGEIGVDGRKVYSTIGILASDFSNGKGESNIKAEANISPFEARYVLQRVQMGLGFFDGAIFSSAKIFGNPDSQGYCPVRKLTIGRSCKDNKGNDRNSPWIVSVENGLGAKAHNANGGTYIQEGTYRCERKVTVYLTDKDFYCHIAHVVAFIDVWEVANGAKLILAGRVALETAKAEYAAEQANNPQNQQNGYGNKGKAQQPPQYQAPPPQPQAATSQPQGSNAAMSLEEARGILISVGTHQGKTLGQLEKEWPKGLAWYFTSYNGKDERLRTGALVVSNALKMAS